MNRRAKSLLGIGVVAIGAAITAYAVHAHLEKSRCFRMINDLEWLGTAPEQELRSVCHTIVSHGYPGEHDAFLRLERIGNKDSVPLLIRALRKRGDPETEEYLVSCDTAHCASALRALTGADSGVFGSAWQQWWEETGAALPETHFYSREANKKMQEIH